MKLETFFEKFDHFAGAPNAVAKMRELIVNLAVAGALVKNSPEDAPVDLPELDLDETHPPNWRLGNLGKILTFEYGKNLPAKKRSESGEYPVFGSNGVVGTHDSYVTKEPAIIIGRKGSAGALNISKGPSWTTDVAYYIVPPDSVDLRFAFYLLTSLRLNELGKGIKPGLSRNEAYALSVRLPPLAEQKRIVAKVDELMALCDRLEAQQQERDTRHAALARASLARFADEPTLAHLDFLFHKSYDIDPADLRKSVLTLAVQGRLVPQEPNDEPAEACFPKLASVSINDDGGTNSADWLHVPLGKMGEWRGGGTPSKSRPEFWTGDVPWVSPKDMKVSRILDAQDHISSAAVEGSSVRLIPKASLLMVVRGMILARAFPVALTMREVTINQDMKALLPFEPESKDYLLVALRAFEPDILDLVERSSHGTCKLKTELVHKFVIPIPPLAEQRRIVAKVDQLMALVDELEVRLVASRTAAKNLLDALVAELTAA